MSLLGLIGVGCFALGASGVTISTVTVGDMPPACSAVLAGSSMLLSATGLMVMNLPRILQLAGVAQ